MVNQENKIDLFKTLEVAHDKYLKSKGEEQKLYEKMNEEILESKRKIKLSYQEKIDSSKRNSTALKKDLENYKKELEYYSTFDSKLIGSIIEKLVTLFEGEEYSFQEIEHDTYEYETGIFGSESFKVNKKISMIVKGSQKQRYYRDYNERDNKIYKLIEKKEAFILGEDKDCHKDSITFYTTDMGNLKCLIDFNKFSYVKEFIDIVIEYKYKNSLSEISAKKLLSLMCEFILNKKEIIEENYKKRILEKQEELMKQLAKEQLKEFKDSPQDNVPKRKITP